MGEAGYVYSPETLAGMRARLPEYLAARGVELRQQGTRLVGRCPVHKDRHPSFAVFGRGGETCGCHPCGFHGDVFATAQWLGRASGFPEAVREVAGALGVSLREGFPARKAAMGRGTVVSTKPQRAVELPAPPDLTEVALREMEAARAALLVAKDTGDLHEVALELRIPLPVLMRCAAGASGLGWHGGMLAYLYPHGMKVRAPVGSRPRFRWVHGKAVEPWRMERVTAETRKIYVCEGESDCLALAGIGLEKAGTAACVASPGTSFPAAWAPLFAGKEVVLCFDKDEAGRAATRRVAGLLHGHAAGVESWKG